MSADDLSRRQAALRAHVVKCLAACVFEAKLRAAEIMPDAPTATGVGVASIGAMANACAWSLGNTMAANGRTKDEMEEVLWAMLHEFTEQFNDGVKHVGEGEMF